ncbi:MAG: hypothetical protein ACFFCV_13210 [Promethearchaeota archaeon]
MDYDALLVTNGLSSLIISIVSIITGLKIASKYLQHKERVLIFAGITWLLMYEGWWGPSISFILLLLTGHGLAIELFYVISISLTPIAITLWMVAFTELKYKKFQKLVIWIFLIQALLFEFFSFYYLITEPQVIVERVGLIDAQYKSFLVLFFLEVAIILTITGILFARESLKINTPEIRLKGIFLLLGFVSFILGSVLDVFLELNIISLLIYRGILVFSSFSFYLGFFLPKSFKKILLKNYKFEK